MAGAEFGADIQMNNSIIFLAVLCKDFRVIGNIVGSSLGQVAALCHMVKNISGSDGDTVFEICAVLDDTQGNDADIVLFDQLLAQVAGAVG